MSKTVPGLSAEYVSFYQTGTTSAPSIRHADSNSTGLYLTPTTLGITQSSANSMVFAAGKIAVSSPLESSSTIAATNLKLTIAGSSNPAQSNYFEAAATTSSTDPLYFTYLAAPRVSGPFMASHSYTLYIAGPPSSGAMPHSFYVNSGTSHFGGPVAICGSLTFLSIGKINIECNPLSTLTYTIPDVGTNAGFIMSSSSGGQVITASTATGSIVKGAILRYGEDGGSFVNGMSGNTVYSTYFAAPTLTNAFASEAATIYVSGPPSGTVSTAYSVLVGGGASQFRGRVDVSSLGFVGDPTTGISWNSIGSYSMTSAGAQTMTVDSSGVALAANKALNFGGPLLMKLAGTPHFALDVTGLATIADGYPGSISGSVSIRGTVSGTGFNTTPITVPVYYFPLGGKAYFIVISNGTSTAWKTAGNPANSNYITITFSSFATVVAAYLTGCIGTTSTSTAATVKNIVLDGYMSGTAPVANSVIMVFPVNSALLASNLWSGSNQALTIGVSGIIFADK